MEQYPNIVANKIFIRKNSRRRESKYTAIYYAFYNSHQDLFDQLVPLFITQIKKNRVRRWSFVIPDSNVLFILIHMLTYASSDFYFLT